MRNSKVRTVKLKDLYPGQVVGVFHSRHASTVIRKVAKNLYELDYENSGRVIQMNRNRICVKRYGVFANNPNTNELLEW
jgi:hypothetical protein